MMFHMTDGSDAHSGAFSAVSFSAVQIASICTAPDAFISIIITQAAR